MLDDYGFEIYEENEFPLAYLLTFRTFGTWLHGDASFSVGRNKNSKYGEPKIQPSVPHRELMESEISQEPVILDEKQRYIVTQAINEVCTFRKYILRASNVRANHTHAVISAAIKPEKIVNDLKSYSTRDLRREWLIRSNEKV